MRVTGLGASLSFSSSCWLAIVAGACGRRKAAAKAWRLATPQRCFAGGGGTMADHNGDNRNSEGGSANDSARHSASKKGWLQDQISGSTAPTRKIASRPSVSKHVRQCTPFGWRRPSLCCGAQAAPSGRRGGSGVAEKNTCPCWNWANPGAYRVFFAHRSSLPLGKANFLRLCLGSSRPWKRCGTEYAAQEKRRGEFSFSHADPPKRHSGMMTLGLMVADTASRPPGTISDVSRVLVSQLHPRVGTCTGYDLPAEGGSSALVKASCKTRAFTTSLRP
jgi:hypothetical protein